MEPFKTRGYVIATTLKYCREGIHPDRRQRALDRISPETVRWIETVKPTEWYPLDRQAEMLHAIAAASEGDPATAEKDLVGSGEFAAREATNTFLRLVMKVLTPGLFAKKLPALYSRDNSKGEVRVDVTEDKVVAYFTGTLGFPHLPAMSAGWMLFALESMGKTISSTKISNWSVQNPDVSNFAVELVWKV